MQLRCKPDELAVISRTTLATRAFDGLLVTTMRLCQVGDFGLHTTDSDFGPWWMVKFAGQRPAYVKHNDRAPGNVGLWPDAWLRPIRNDGSEFDETMFWPCGMPKREQLSPEELINRVVETMKTVCPPRRHA